jgi:hypothetical protein
MVIEYTMAVRLDVPEELFSWVVQKYGEKETIELTAGKVLVLLGHDDHATGTDFDFGYGKPGA